MAQLGLGIELLLLYLMYVVESTRLPYSVYIMITYIPEYFKHHSDTLGIRMIEYASNVSL